MTLTPQQFAQLQNALLGAFNSEELGRMVYIGLGQRLDDIASGETDPAMVFSLLQWALRTDSVPALVQAAVDANPKNEALRQVARDSMAWFVPDTPISPVAVEPAVSKPAENDSDEKKQRPSFWHFWTTLPGILTAIAGVIVALTGCVIALYSAGLLPRFPPSSIPTTEIATPTVQFALSTPADIPGPATSGVADATNEPRPSDIMTNTIDGAVYVYVPEGPFVMGSDDKQDVKASNDEQPTHTVTLPGFWIMRTEVTNAQYARCVAMGACTTPAPNPVGKRWNDSAIAEHPVVEVDWNQASTVGLK